MAVHHCMLGMSCCLLCIGGNNPIVVHCMLLAYRAPCDAEQELLCDHCSEPKATNQVLQQWEQQVTRRSIQHQLKQQREQMQDEGDGQQQEPDEEAGAQAGAVAADGSSVTVSMQQQQLVKPRPGVWGSARAQSLPVSAGFQQKPRHLQDSNGRKPATSNSSAAGDHDDDTPAATLVSGVKPPAAGPVVKPHLARKRPGSRLAAAGTFGTFKAPRMVQPYETGKENEVRAGDDRCLHGLSHVGKEADSKSSSTEEQQQPSAIDVTADGSPPGTAAAESLNTATAAARAVAQLAAQPSQIGRTGRGRHAFVPPLKRS